MSEDKAVAYWTREEGWDTWFRRRAWANYMRRRSRRLDMNNPDDRMFCLQAWDWWQCCRALYRRLWKERRLWR